MVIYSGRKLFAVAVILGWMIAPLYSQTMEKMCEGAEYQNGRLTWPHPRFKERHEERLRMVEEILDDPYVTIGDERVIEAMKAVPRHLFVPEEYQEEAYDNHPLPIGEGQTISQPLIVALMTDLLELRPGDKVLEIGTGSGYQAAVLAELTPCVYTVEIIPGLAERARQTFAALGYTTIRVREGDGYEGWPEHAPYDGIIVTCAPEEIPPPLIEQLRPGGRIVIPVGKAGWTQWLIVVHKDRRGRLHRHKEIPVSFVPMTGKAREH